MASIEDLEMRLNQLETAISGRGGFGPVTDPAPDEWRWPRPFPFPYPWPRPWPRPIPQWPPIWDPAPDGGGWTGGGFGGGAGGGFGGPGGGVVDPSPIDFGRLSRLQLEGLKDHIALERKRFDALEALIDSKLKKSK